jgi:hypothetical protein
MHKGLQAQHNLDILRRSYDAFNVYGKAGKTYKLMIPCDNRSSK